MDNDFVGFGALGEAMQHLAENGYEKIFVVASKTGWERFNAKGTYPFFAQSNVQLFSDFGTNPDFADIKKGAELFKTFDPDILIAVGGGSPIDVAKVIKVLTFTREPYDPEKPESLKPSGEGPPLVAIATTAGSGSEATQYAVFYVGKNKQSLAHPSIRPDIAVVDPELTYSMPPHQTAATGFDALSQAVEAFWASSTTPEAQELASAAIGYVIPNIYNATTAPAPGNRYHMAQAAYLAGKAINITRTTIPHALAYHLTKEYNLAHGHAVAITLPYCFLANLDPRCEIITPLGADAHRANMEKLIELLGQKTAEDCFVFWRNLMKACGLPETLNKIGLTTEKQVRDLIATMNPARMKNHPVRIDADYLTELFMNNP